MAKNIVLVTGTSSGFGEMIALELARAGYTVYGSETSSTPPPEDEAANARAVSTRPQP